MQRRVRFAYLSVLILAVPWVMMMAGYTGRWSERNVLPVPLATAQSAPKVFLPAVVNGGPNGGSQPSPAPTLAGQPAVLMAAGDIASCTNSISAQTAVLIGNSAAAVAALGDDAYESGTSAEFTNCYDPTWGQFKGSTHPAPGNHDYLTPGAQGYFDYFGAAAGNPSEGYYSYSLGAWHILVINSNCSEVGGCKVGSTQESWVRADLTAHPAACTLAYWHHPLYSSGQYGGWAQMADIWADLYRAGAEVVLSGHDHDYERFKPQDAAGQFDPARGIVQFVVGTGGKELTALNLPQPNSVVSNNDTPGVLKMSLYPSGYQWEFLPVPGHSFTDSGSAACH